jgi:heptosyltransferase-2
MKILIVGPSWVGDTILAQPLFKLLHRRWSDLQLDVLAPQWAAPLLGRMREVNRTIVNPFAHGELRLSERWQLGRSLAPEGYDQAIVLPNSLKSALVPAFAAIPRRTGYRGEARWGLLNDVRRLDPNAVPLMVTRFAALAGDADGPPPADLPRAELQTDAAARHAVLERLRIKPEKPVVAFCPGAEYGPAKRWPAASFAELARRLSSRNREIWLIGSLNDAPTGDDIVRLSGGICRNLCGATTLLEAVDLISAAELVVSNDSGLMHVAAALDRPLVALYGSSSPGFTPPMSDHAEIVKLDMPCSPCFKRECPLGHFKCMRDLTPAMVDEKIAGIYAAR